MKVELNIDIARAMYKSGNEALYNFAKLYYLIEDLDFNPKFGDIISNKDYIVIVNNIENDIVLPIIYYDINENKLKCVDYHSNLLNIGNLNIYRHANESEKKFLLSEIKKQLKQND